MGLRVFDGKQMKSSPSPTALLNHTLKPFRALIRISTKFILQMKKIDILNYITDFRKSPNDIKTYGQLITHLGAQHEPVVQAMLNELKQLGVIKETEHQGERAYQVAKK